MAVCFFEFAALCVAARAAAAVAVRIIGEDRARRFIHFIGFGDKPSYRG